MIAGALLLAVGAAMLYAPWLVNWFGKLPGDIRYESGTTRVYIPIVSMLLISIVLSLIFALFRR